MDATNIERNLLYLTMQLLELIFDGSGANMMDECARTAVLSVSTNWRKNWDSGYPDLSGKIGIIGELIDHALHVTHFQEKNRISVMRIITVARCTACMVLCI